MKPMIGLQANSQAVSYSCNKMDSAVKHKTAQVEKRVSQVIQK